MAHPDVVINGITYSACPEVDIPKAGSGTAKFYDVSNVDASASNVLAGKVFVGSSGEDTGSMANNGSVGGSISTKAGTVTIPEGFTSGGSVGISAAEQAKIIASNIRTGVTILGQAGSLSTPTISQNSTTKVLSIS